MLAGDGHQVRRRPHPSHVLGQDPHGIGRVATAHTTFGPRRRAPFIYARPTDHPRLALFDWDNTLHHGWTLEGWVDYLVGQDVVSGERRPEWEARKQRYLDGRIDHNQFAEEANGEYARALAGWSLEEAAPLIRRFVAETDHRQIYPWAPPLLRWLAEHGTRPVIISGAPQEILTQHLQQLRLDDLEVHGLTLAVEGDGRFVGTVASNVGTDRAKRELIGQLAATGRACGPAAGARIVLGVGDSTSDLPLLRAARRQLVVGSRGRPLLEQLGASAACVPEPYAATAEEMIHLVRVLVES